MYYLFFIFILIFYDALQLFLILFLVRILLLFFLSFVIAVMISKLADSLDYKNNSEAVFFYYDLLRAAVAVDFLIRVYLPSHSPYQSLLLL